ncbi:hypothetical protein EOD39_9321 [Acipenser ruthenus]|uniref:Uncharacterized protein n=1 Tax=Acipenser ruthenus TaxID=7906 RepID=A0A444U170_ACIRT|nr:hypothetical protein EOD39_9321 [Acipenser ruthenus]
MLYSASFAKENPDKAGGQTTITFAKKPTSLTQSRKDEITSKVVNFLVQEMHPLSIVEDEPFIEVLHRLEPQYKVPCRKTSYLTPLQHHYFNSSEFTIGTRSLLKQAAAVPGKSSSQSKIPQILDKSKQDTVFPFVMWELKEFSGMRQDI